VSKCVFCTVTTSILHLSLLCRQVMSAPNWLRVGTTENIFVEYQDYPGEDIRVEIVVMNFPTKTQRLASTTVTLTRRNQFQELAQIKVMLNKDPNIKQYVFLQANFPGKLLEQIVLVSFQSGYIFIQTDKTLYTPGSTGEFNVSTLTPEGIILPLDAVTLRLGIHSGSYRLGEVVSFGLWKVVAKFSNVPQQSFSAEFEVREHVLPSLEVKLTPERPFFYVDSPELTVNIRATYIFGEEVNGVAYVVFGVVQDGTKRSFPGSLQRVQIAKGDGQVTLKREHITETFQNILDLVGSSIYVSVSVLTESGSEMVEAESRGIKIVTSPYTIHLRKTARHFKPGMPFTVVARTNDPLITPERQASTSMTALPYTSGSNNYIHIGEGHPDMTILSRGQLVKKGRYRTRGQALNPLMVPITKEMLPSFRIIAYYHTDDNEVVSDSVWVDVKDSCMGSLKLEPARPAPSYEPRRMFRLKVTGDPEATVGLVAVDKGVYILNNKHRLTQKKVWDIVEKSDTGCTPGGGRDAMSVFYDAGLMFESEASGTPIRQGDFTLPSTERTLVNNHCEEDDDSYADSGDVTSRTQFPESWLWSDIRLPACPQQTPNCDTTTVQQSFPLKDSITTWQFTGISLSQTNGICVGEPLEVIVRKEFFIDLRLPYSAVRGEQIEIKAILHNYSPDPVRVDLIETPQSAVCSSASKRGKYRQEVNVGPETTRSVPYIIIPMKQGQHPIEVKAVVKDSALSDGIRKMLRVVVRIKVTKGAVQRISCIQSMTTPSENQHINLSSQRIRENAISGQSMGTLIQQPGGCGEQNMIGMTLPVIAVTYLDKTNQWEAVGPQKRGEALDNIKTGYVNQLKYRKDDGSFAQWAHHDSSTWLTAYVAKVFAMANNLVAVQPDLICDAVKFLINAQQDDGMFREVGVVIHGEMTGDVRGTDSGASMTAFCLIAMQESRSLCEATVNRLQASIDRAVAYLERRLPALTNPYAVAMTSYALANENKLNLEILKNFALEDAKPVVRWLIKQQKVGGGYGSTQATIMVYQAVAEYWAYAEELEYNLNVDILLPGKPKAEKYNFNRDNHYTTRTSRMVSLYYTLPTEKESDCQKFNVFYTHYAVHFLCRYKDEERDATMSILDIGLLTGFTANTEDLNLLSKGRARTIANYEMNTVLSERGSLIIYLDKVSHTRPEEITFRVHQQFNVGVLQPAAVSVYEYYDQTPCVKFYRPERVAGKLLRLCRGDECTCAEGKQDDNTNIVLHRGKELVVKCIVLHCL
uniref:NTR domain-containing protein n=1 Tax=Sparus aurata TaxID=8175 RepID=A0A671YFA6_SPAAU